jgi:hypothetical protein
MSTNTSSATIVQRLWNYCNVLRDELLENTANPAGSTIGGRPAALEQFRELAEDLGARG